MYGIEYIEDKEAKEAEEQLLAAVRFCKEKMDRFKLERVLAWHLRNAQKGPHTGDSDHLGTPFPS